MPVQTAQQRQATFQAAGQQPVPQQLPNGWDATTYANFKAANPNLEPTAEDTARMLAAGSPKAAQNLTPLQTPTPATSIKPAPTVNIPQPTAPAVQSSYFGSVASDVQTTQAALQSAYDKQSTQIQSQLDTLKSQQQTELDAEQQLSQPFNAQLEQNQEQQLGVNANFQKNQALADELNSIVNQANTQLTNGQNRFASASTIQATQNSTISALTARAGLIQAAMSAYSGQISAAYTQIDRSVAAMNADNTDQLNYYNTLLTLNQNDQLTLTDEQKTNVQNQITTLQQQSQDAQTTADNIKQAMLDPDTAQAYAQAGVTLADTPEEINTKLGNYAYSKELSDQSNQMAQSGFSAVVPGQSAPAGAQVVTVTDSKGNQKQYYKQPTSSSDLGSILDTMDTSGVGDTTGASSTDILSATGLSLPVFNYLTQGTSALSRLSAADRGTIMSQASQWAQQNGVDVSTFQSQYKAYNDVLQKNIERANNTSIFANEVSGTTDQFVADVGLDIGDLKAANVASLFATGQTNDPTTQKYAFDLQTMQNDLAGYYAASRGATSPDDSDLRSAANVITNGINAGSAEAFKESIQANEKKVTNVVNQAVDGARQDVWSLFGVGDQYQSTTKTTTPTADQLDSETSDLDFSDNSSGSTAGSILGTVGNVIAGIFGF